MKGLKIAASVGGIAVVALGAIAATTNPSRDAYEDYATQRLSEYVQEKGCEKAPSILKSRCVSLISSSQPQIEKLIAQSTERQNFGILSVYKTDLAIHSMLPSFHFETVGAFGSFHTYEARQE